MAEGWLLPPEDVLESWAYMELAVGPAQKGRSRLVRRLDRILNGVSAAALVALLSPVLVVTAFAIKLDSRGPALFVQPRVGSQRVLQDGELWWKSRAFDLLKFRSMTEGIDQSAHEEYIRRFIAGGLEDETSEGGEFKMAGDPRVTRVGRMIRRLSIDELPQLFNVIMGHMNLVGPRPVPVYEVAEYEPWHMERLHAVPGMTGYWQVRGRGRVPFEEMVRMDIWYTRNRSFLLDLRMLAATIPAVVRMRGAG